MLKFQHSVALFLIAGFCLNTFVFSDDEFNDFTAREVIDRIEINQQILSYQYLAPSERDKALDELDSLKNRLSSLRDNLGENATDDVMRRMIDNGLRDAKRLLGQNSSSNKNPSNSKNQKHPQLKQAADPEALRRQLNELDRSPPEDASQEALRLGELSEMVRQCSQTILDLYRQNRAGNISTELMRKKIHRLENVTMEIIKRKEAIHRKMDGRKGVAVSSPAALNPNSSMMDQLVQRTDRRPRISPTLPWASAIDSDFDHESYLAQLRKIGHKVDNQAMHAAYVSERLRVRREARAQQERLALARRRNAEPENMIGLDRARRDAIRAVQDVEEQTRTRARVNGDSRWSEVEEEQYRSLVNNVRELMQPTPAELKAMQQHQPVRTRVATAIRLLAPRMGNEFSVEQTHPDRAERESINNAFNGGNGVNDSFGNSQVRGNEFWNRRPAIEVLIENPYSEGNGEMYMQIGQDWLKQNEDIARYDLDVRASEYYLKRPSLTQEDIKVAREFWMRSINRRGHRKKFVLLTKHY